MRKIIPWNQDWKFVKEDKYIMKKGLEPECTWESITLPHTWNAYDGQDGGNDYYQGVAWYQKIFTMDGLWGNVYIRFGAVSKKAEVWCNGHFVGEHLGGFSAFTFCITPYLQEGTNEILVKANNSNELPTYPKQADFTFFGGIYRDVELICLGKEAHFDATTYGTDALFVTPKVDGAVEVAVFVVGGKCISTHILDGENNRIGVLEKILDEAKDGTSQKVEFSLQINNPHLWNGVNDPYLYKIKVFLDDGQDVLSTTFGFRDYEVTAEQGFYLNGQTYPLHGVCRHQDRENMGWAITEKEHGEDMDLINEIGANTVRLAHYQQAPFFYDLCDQRGMVAWAEIPFISVYEDNREADKNLKQQMKELVLQNYNHPSICFWGIANEVGIGSESQKLYQILEELQKQTKQLDPSRLTVIANVSVTKMSSPLFHITDVTTYNEYKGWYEGTMQDHGSFCDQCHNEMPEIPLGISEYGAESILSWHSEQPKVKDYTEEYQALVHETAEKAFRARPFIWGTWLWNMFDFAADARDEGGCKGRNNKGLVTYDRSKKKQGFYYYKACWSKEPFVYICGKRFTKHAIETINIKAYSNQKQVTLWVNDVLVETKCQETIFEFQEVLLSKQFNEIKVCTEDGCTDCLILEKVDSVPEEYVLKEEKNLSSEVSQWFAGLQKDSSKEIVQEIIVYEGYLSVYDSMEEIYTYPEGFVAVQEIIAKPMMMDNPSMASRMSQGGAMSFSSIWNHINKLLPDEAIYILNERLNKIRK